MSTVKVNLMLLAVLLSAAGATAIRTCAQQPPPPSPSSLPDEIVRIHHRVVFLDALVRDKRTSNLASDLRTENFEVYADGKPRQISYFSREGDETRKPLALVLVLDLRRDGAGRFLRRTEILEAMMNELAKLPAGDEVAILVLQAGGDSTRRQWLTHFTRDRAQISTALSVIPSLVAEGSCCGEQSSAAIAGKGQEKGGARTEGKDAKGGGEARAARDETTAMTIEKAEPEGDKKPPNEIESETKIVAKNGDTVTKTIYKDGRVKTKKVSHSGTVEVEMDEEFDLAGAAHTAAELALKERPDSQAALVWISDGLVPVFYVERDVAVAELTKANVIFSALVTDMKLGFKLFKPILKPLGNWAGMSIYDSAQHVAKETGGEALGVNRPADYASGLNKIIGNLTGRYSLGFTLAETEQDDGQMHQLEVRVRARDAKGKERRLQVVSRHGYFMPKNAEAALATEHQAQ